MRLNPFCISILFLEFGFQVYAFVSFEPLWFRGFVLVGLLEFGVFLTTGRGA